MLISILRGIKYDYLEAPKGGDHDDSDIIERRLNAGLDVFGGKTNITVTVRRAIKIDGVLNIKGLGDYPETKYTGSEPLFTGK